MAEDGGDGLSVCRCLGPGRPPSCLFPQQVEAGGFIVVDVDIIIIITDVHDPPLAVARQVWRPRVISAVGVVLLPASIIACIHRATQIPCKSSSGFSVHDWMEDGGCSPRLGRPLTQRPPLALAQLVEDHLRYICWCVLRVSSRGCAPFQDTCNYQAYLRVSPLRSCSALYTISITFNACMSSGGNDLEMSGRYSMGNSKAQQRSDK